MTASCLSAHVDVVVAICGVVMKKVESWAIRIENANLGEFERLKSATENKVENGAG